MTDAPKPAPATQQAPQQSGVGNSGFDHNTAADFLNGKTVSDEAMRKFVNASRWAHDDRASLRAMLLSARNELAAREAEIALLKIALMDAEERIRQAVALERARWEEALRLTWQMVDPLKPAGMPGSYARGQDSGIVAALNTLRANLKTPNAEIRGGEAVPLD